jgi:transposase
MKMNKRRSFSDAFKSEAVRRVIDDGRKPAQVASELGVPRQLIGAWLKRALPLGAVREDPLKESQKAELKRLKRANERLTMELEIAKKAAAFFARESL